MALVTLVLPPGVYRNGTEYQAMGRWYDASLVRWIDGTMQPVGGWQERVDSTVTSPRAILTWQDLSSNRRLALANWSTVVAITDGGVVTDITPAGLTVGSEDAEINTGYGGGFYGLDFYGTERPATGEYGEATTWAMDNWGEYLVACSVADGRLWEWQLDTGLNLAAISGAPTGCLSLVVTAERFLFALGAGGNPRKVQWCDREANTVWTPAATNEAGDIELQTAGQIMCGRRVRGQTLILTDQDAHSATYQGPPFVYGFERVGSSCGSISRSAAVVVDQGCFWMGQRGFFVYRGNQVEDLPSEVNDYVFSDINGAQQTKIFGMANAQFGEIWWFYPSSTSNENDRYVVYNFKEGHWAIGALNRTCGADRGVFRRPLMAATTGMVYDHEIGLDRDGASIYAESGPMQIGQGDRTLFAVQLVPDERTQGDVTATFKTRLYPNDTEREHGPYTLANPTDVRFSGRQVRARVDGAVLADWRVGVMRLDVIEGGAR